MHNSSSLQENSISKESQLAWNAKSCKKLRTTGDVYLVYYYSNPANIFCKPAFTISARVERRRFQIVCVRGSALGVYLTFLCGVLPNWYLYFTSNIHSSLPSSKLYPNALLLFPSSETYQSHVICLPISLPQGYDTSKRISNPIRTIKQTFLDISTRWWCSLIFSQCVIQQLFFDCWMDLSFTAFGWFTPFSRHWLSHCIGFINWVTKVSL